MARPKTYGVNSLSCLNCKYLLINRRLGSYCSYGESRNKEDLLLDPEWKNQNVVSFCGYCANLEKDG
jgi:hypothetical protein